MKMHLEGMLDRDQRTTKSRMYVIVEVPEISEIFRECSYHDEIDDSYSSSINIIPGTRKSSTVFYSISKRGYLIHSFQRLKKVLLVLAYLITIITLPTSNSAPTDRNMDASMSSVKDRWINPNNYNTPQDVTDFRGTKNDIMEYLSKSGLQAGIALSRAKNFKDTFANNMFNKSFDELVTLFKTQSYHWIMKAPKNFDDNIASDQLRELKMNETFLDVYGYLQSVAVGMDQAVRDQKVRDQKKLLNMFPEFNKQFDNLILVLCELQTSMYDMNIPMRPDITRDIMTDEFRFNMDNTQTTVRDFIIFREYMNTLDYIVKAFDYLKEHL